MKPDMIILPSGCKEMFKQHLPHNWREGFLWLTKVECPGHIQKSLSDWEKSNPETHKHKLRFSGLSYISKSGERTTPSDYDLIFKCRTCKDPVWPFEVRIKRWKWDEMTRDFSGLDQTWPG